MSMNGSELASVIQKALTERVVTTTYDSKGRPRQVTTIVQPPIQSTQAIAENTISHIQRYGEVNTNVDVTTVNTQIQGQTLPGIPLIAGAFPGSTTGPGIVQGTGVGTGRGYGTGKVS